MFLAAHFKQNQMFDEIISFVRPQSFNMRFQFHSRSTIKEIEEIETSFKRSSSVLIQFKMKKLI